MALAHAPRHSPSSPQHRIRRSVAALVLSALVAATVGSIAISPAPAATGTQATTTPDVSGEYTAVAAPTRLLDTRDGTGRGGVVAPLGGGQTLVLGVLGKAGVPAAGVSAVTLNVTVTNPSDASFLTAWPTGSARPTSSVSNFVAGQTRANLIMIGVGPSGTVSFYNRFGTVDVIVDLAGWFSSTDVNPGSVFHSVPAARIVDTRSGDGHSGPIAGGQVVHVDVTGVGGVPATGVTDVLVNVTAPAPTAPGYITMFGSGNLPGASTLNPDPGRDVSNLALVHVADDGTISVFAFGAPTNLVVDVVGYFDTADSATASGFSPIVPQRAFDTRSEFVAASVVAPILRQLVVSPDVTPDSVAAVIAGITVTEPTSAGYVSVFPAGATWPGNSNVNFNAGDTIPNLIASGVDQSGRAAIRLSAGAASVLADVYGYFVLRNTVDTQGRPTTTTNAPTTTTKAPTTTTTKAPTTTTTKAPTTTTKAPTTTTTTAPVPATAAGSSSRQAVLAWLGTVDLDTLGQEGIASLVQNGVGGAVVMLGTCTTNAIPAWQIAEWKWVSSQGDLYVGCYMAAPAPPTTSAQQSDQKAAFAVVAAAAKSANAKGFALDAEPYGSGSEDAWNGIPSLKSYAQTLAPIIGFGQIQIYPSSNASWPGSYNDVIQLENNNCPGQTSCYATNGFGSFIDGLLAGGASVNVTDASFHWGAQASADRNGPDPWGTGVPKSVALAKQRFPSANFAASIMFWPDNDEGHGDVLARRDPARRGRQHEGVDWSCVPLPAHPRRAVGDMAAMACRHQSRGEYLATAARRDSQNSAARQ